MLPLFSCVVVAAGTHMVLLDGGFMPCCRHAAAFSHSLLIDQQRYAAAIVAGRQAGRQLEFVTSTA